jgi:outer membrane protein TolC
MFDRRVVFLVFSIMAAAPPAPVVVRADQPVAPASSSATASTADDPPSTVSPAIERYLKQSGQDVPPPIKPASAKRASAVPAPGSNPLRASRTSGTPNGPAAENLEDVLRTLPREMQGARENDDADSTVNRPSPLATNMILRAAPFEPADFRFPMNLATALKLADARPLIVASAQASVWAAEAELSRAKVLWIPALNFAVDYLRHDGGGPDFNKGILTSPSVNFFYAGGGLYGVIPTTEAIFEPIRARHMLNSTHYNVQSAKNDVLLQTADAYFLVHQHRGRFSGALYCVERAGTLLERIATLSRDLVPRLEVDRARNMLADLEQRAVSERQQWRVRSADLSQILRLDPRAVVDPLEKDHLQITLVDPARPLEQLMMIALDNRPELGSRRALIKAAETGIRREQGRMILPTVYLTGYQSPGGMLIQAGLFGLGPNSSLNQWTGRDDVSVQLMWQFESFGIGNLARIKSQRGQQSQAIVDLYRTQDMVAADVNRAQARVQSAAARVRQADRALREGIITLNGQFEGLKQTRRFGDTLVLVNRPQEAVYALQQLNRTFIEYFNTVSEYNRAQFDLFHAIGYPAYEVSARNLPGEAIPVNTTRPSFLPRVGNGPPPATR